MIEPHIALMEAVARHFFGEPNPRLSNKSELRFGTNGSKSVDLKKGVWFDHEAGKGGGPLDLIMRELNLTSARECYKWAEQQGYWRNGQTGASGTHFRRANDKAKQVATYDYTDESGALLFQKVRYEPKQFKLRRPDGKGDWIWKDALDGVRRVVYRLPEAVETVSLGHLIVVVEGEKDVDNCRRLGIPATCNYEGAGAWSDEQTATFSGADVCIVADNDEPGRKHVAAVAAKLTGTAKRVRVLDLAAAWPQCPDKGDVSDWIAAGGTVERLYQIIEKLPDWQPRSSALTLRFGYEAMRPQPIGTVVRGLLHLGSLTLFYGPPKSGKSFLVTSLFLAIAAGDPEWMGHRIIRGGPVLYVACEGHAGFWKRLAAAAKERGWDENTFPADFVLATGRPQLIHLNDRTHAAIPRPDDVVTAVAQAKANGRPPIAVAIDTVFRSIGGGDVSKSDHMNAYLAALATILDDHIAVAAVHHETKAGGTPAGSVALTGSADTIVLTEKLEDNEHCWHIEDAKDDAQTEPRKFTLTVVDDLGLDDDGEPVVSCVVHPAMGPIFRGKPLKPEFQEFRRILVNVIASHGGPIKPLADMPTVTGIDRKAARDFLVKAGWFHPGLLCEDGRLRRAAYGVEQNALIGLKRRGFIEFTREYVWLPK